MVGRGRLELPTSRLSSARSNQLSYRPVAFGGGDRDRTDDLLLAKQALSQLSYTPKLTQQFDFKSITKKRKNVIKFNLIFY